MKYVFALVLASMSCAHTETSAPTVYDATKEALTGCTQIRIVEGMAPWTGEAATRRAKDSARTAIAREGGTHIVWEPSWTILLNTGVRGVAYKCPNGYFRSTTTTPPTTATAPTASAP